MCELAKELRIGNYVHSNIIEDIIQVSVITSEINAKPILLTEQWLITFRYIKLSEKYFTIQGHLIWICNDLFMCDKNGIVLKYVHQLQNLYYALNQKELTHQKIN